jgi:hypothetical protein
MNERAYAPLRRVEECENVAQRSLEEAIGRAYLDLARRCRTMAAHAQSADWPRGLPALQNCFSVAQRPIACRDDFSGFCHKVLFLRIVSRSRSAFVAFFLCGAYCGEFCKALADLKALSLISLPWDARQCVDRC